MEVQARVGGYLTPRWSFAIDRRSEDAGAIPSRRLGKAEHADLGMQTQAGHADIFSGQHPAVHFRSHKIHWKDTLAP